MAIEVHINGSRYTSVQLTVERKLYIAKCTIPCVLKMYFIHSAGSCSKIWTKNHFSSEKNVQTKKEGWCFLSFLNVIRSHEKTETNSVLFQLYCLTVQLPTEPISSYWMCLLNRMKERKYWNSVTLWCRCSNWALRHYPLMCSCVLCFCLITQDHSYIHHNWMHDTIPFHVKYFISLSGRKLSVTIQLRQQVEKQHRTYTSQGGTK